MLKKILNQLTIEEKIGQLVQIDPAVYNQDSQRELFGKVENLYYNPNDKYLYGSVLGINNKKEALRIQKDYLSSSRHKIPLIYMSDVIHGCHTVFPIPLAQAASFNLKLVERAASIAAKEAASAGIHVTFSPMLDVTRDPRWGRVMEGYGEDHYLAGKMGLATIKGYQGNFSNQNIAACIKHFAGYGAPDAGRDYNTVNLSKNAFNNYYLPAYEKALEANPLLVMSSFNTLFGVPATGNKFLLREILRKQNNFKGVIISDFGSVKEMINHKYAKDSIDAAIKALTAGLDIDMMSDVYSKHLIKAIKMDDKLTTLLDEAVYRVLVLKEKLGLFQDPFRGLKEADFDLKYFDDGTNLKLALESAVLLKNNYVLPLKNEKIHLMGEFCDSKKTNGNWSWLGGHISNNQTLKDLLPNQTDYKDADIIIYCFGESEKESGEAQSKTNPSILEKDLNEIKRIKQDNKTIIGIVYSGRPLIFTEAEPYLDAIIYGFYLGNKMSEALKQLLFGEANFSARLPITIPKNVGQIPIYYNNLNTGRPSRDVEPKMEYVSNYLDETNRPLYGFGEGLSYSIVNYNNLKVNKKTLKKGETITLSIEIENESSLETKEVVQVYFNDLFAEIARPNFELVAFRKVFLNKNEKKEINIDLNYRDFMYKDDQNNLVLEPGAIKIMIGSPQKILLETKITIV
jgi:beta-glucosidase